MLVYPGFKGKAYGFRVGGFRVFSRGLRELGLGFRGRER